ncbi:MAG: hypothetical protein R2764_02795 [Bacteroidales bacterium]
MKCSHQFSHYQDSLNKAFENGYHFLMLKQFKQIENYQKVILLRHDVDLLLKNALIMAKIENEMKIKATYFIQVSGKYNLMFYPNFKLVNSIAELGHEIGLHYSLDIPQMINVDTVGYFLREKRIVEDTLGQKISGICLHDPNSRNKINIDLDKYDLEYDAYSDTIVSQLHYISDSRASWREGCMCKNIGKHPKLYILTHPFWWYEKSSCENY